jgi:hypothetical protein
MRTFLNLLSGAEVLIRTLGEQLPLQELITFLRRERKWLQAGLTISVLLISAFFLYRYHAFRPIVFLVSDRGSSNLDMTGRIIDKLREFQRAPGVPYEIHIQYTSGFEEAEDIIESRWTPESSSILGYAIDGVKGLEHTKYVLPLDFCYLHVLCRREHLDGEVYGTNSPPKISEAIHRVQELIRSGQAGSMRRIYAGPKGSSIRVIAAEVLSHFNVEIDDVEHLSIRDWNQAESAIKTGEIDLLFTFLPYNAPLVFRLARESHVGIVLLDLSEVCDSLSHMQRFSLQPVPFPANAYRFGEVDMKLESVHANSVQSVGKLSSSQHIGSFCYPNTKTVVGRRLLVCPKSMDAYDVFNIGQAARFALRHHHGPEVGSWSVVPPELRKPDDRSNFDVRMPRHTGGDAIETETPPSSFFRPETWSLQWLIGMSSVVSFLATAVYRAFKDSRTGARTVLDRESDIVVSFESFRAFNGSLSERIRKGERLSSSDFSRLEDESALRARECYEKMKTLSEERHEYWADRILHQQHIVIANLLLLKSYR